MIAKINRLTAAFVAKSDLKPGLHADGGGLYLQVKGQARSWLLRYMLNGKPRYLGLGSASVFSLAEARQRARAARQKIADGIDPVAEKRSRKAASQAEAAKRMTLREAAEHYVAANAQDWSDKHATLWRQSFERHVFPTIGDLDISAIGTPDVLRVLEPLWSERTVTAGRLRARLETLLDWGKARGLRSGENPAAWAGHLSIALPPRHKIARTAHLDALPYAEVPGLMQKLRGEAGMPHRALEFTILTAARTREVLDCTWTEIDFEAAVWTIPDRRTKAGREHRVPLSDRALEILRDLPRGEPEGLVFPDPVRRRGGRGAGGPLRQVAMLEALRALGVSATVHGFRSSFRDWGGDATSFSRDVIEAAFAQAVGDVTERSFRRSDALAKRARLMQAWSDHCGSPAAGADAKVLPLKRPKTRLLPKLEHGPP